MDNLYIHFQTIGFSFANSILWCLFFFLLNIILMRLTHLVIIACSFLLIYNVYILYVYIDIILLLHYLLVILLLDNTIIYLCVLSLMNF